MQTFQILNFSTFHHEQCPLQTPRRKHPEESNLGMKWLRSRFPSSRPTIRKLPVHKGTNTTHLLTGKLCPRGHGAKHCSPSCLLQILSHPISYPYMGPVLSWYTSLRVTERSQLYDSRETSLQLKQVGLRLG